ncbi:MAG: hypothetical protein V1712_00835 [Patescibacteria group bacterium]
MKLRQYLFTSSFITAIAIVFILLIAAGCTVILEKQVDLKQQGQPNIISTTDTIKNLVLPQIELADLSEGFSIQNSKENSSEAVEQKAIGFENEVFKNFDPSSYSKVQKMEFISYKIVRYNNEADLLKDLEDSKSLIDGKNNLLLDTKNIVIGDDRYMYKSIKPIIVEGHNSIIIGITFRIGNIIVSTSDSGFDETILKNRVITLSKIMEYRVRDYLIKNK